MPIYEYACGACLHRFETLQKASEEPLRDCPECGEAALRKLLSAPVFRLKGGGWYETDFKTGDRRNLAGGEAGAGKEAGKNGEGANGGSDANGGGTTAAQDKPAAAAKAKAETGAAKPAARSGGAKAGGTKASAGSAAGAG